MQSHRSLISSWHVLPLTIGDQQQHIEQSERLLATALPEEPPTLYWSIAEPVGLVLGYSQKPEMLNPAVVQGQHGGSNSTWESGRPQGSPLQHDGPQQSDVPNTSVVQGQHGDRKGSPLLYDDSQKPNMLNQPIAQQAAVQGKQILIYHRRAGGTAVLVGPDLLSLDVVLPAGHPLILSDIVESYRWFGEAWVATLAQFGVEARTVSPQEAHEQRARLKQEEIGEREIILRRACYGSLSPYEVVVGQRKVVGLDMIRRRVGTLLQAGVLLHWETESLAQLLGHTPEEQAILREGLLERAVGIDTLLGHVVVPEEIIIAFEKVLFSM